MESKIVVLRYNPEKLSESFKSSMSLVNGTSDIDFSVDNFTLEETNLPSSRIVKLQYKNRSGEKFDGTDGSFDLSPSKSFQLHPSRSATPPTLTGSQEVATISNSQYLNEDSYTRYKDKSRSRVDQYTSIYRPFDDLERNMENESIKSNDRVDFQSQLKNGKPLVNIPNPYSLLVNKASRTFTAAKRTHTQALDSMDHYKKTFEMSDINLEDLEDDWLLNMRIITERLHFLKEAHKAVQTTKKHKVQLKSDPNIQRHSNSSVIKSSLYLEEEHPSSSQNQPPLFQNDDEDSGSNSNTDTLSAATHSILEPIRPH